jgi:hypothetical protein
LLVPSHSSSGHVKVDPTVIVKISPGTTDRVTAIESDCTIGDLGELVARKQSLPGREACALVECFNSVHLDFRGGAPESHRQQNQSGQKAKGGITSRVNHHS